MDTDQFKADILIVDDEPVNLKILLMALESQHYRVREAASGFEALETVRENRPDLVLLDIRMPGMDGYETCEALKTDDYSRDIPVIFISAEDDTRHKVRALEAGGADYVTKPFTFEEVLARIDVQLRISRQQKEIQRLREQDQKRIQQLHGEIERRTEIEEIERQQRIFAEALSNMAATVNSILDLDEVLNRVLDNLQWVIPHDMAEIILFEGDQARLVSRREDGQDGLQNDTVDLIASDLLALVTRVEHEETAIILDSSTDFDWPDALDHEQNQTRVVAPVRAQGQLLGLLNVISYTPESYTPAQVDRLQAFANQVTVALYNAQLHEQLNRYTTQLESQVEQRTQELRQAKERVEVILNNVENALVLVDITGALQTSNAALERVLGYPPDRMWGRPLSVLFVPDNHHDVNQIVAEVVDARQVRQIELIARRQDGTTFEADFVLSPILDESAQVMSMVGSIRNISQQKQLESSLREALDRERELGALKSRFIESVSHEFRTPLAVIQSSGEMLINYHDRMSPEQRAEKFKKIEAGIRRMITLLDSVLAADHSSWGE